MKKLIDGKAIAKHLEQDLIVRVTKLKKKGITPKLAVILVGKHKPSQTYVRKKGEAARRVGMEFSLTELPGNTSKKRIIDTILRIQEDQTLSGLIVQLPLPEPLYTTEVLNAIRPELDVDCLTDTNLGKLVMTTHTLTPPTPGAVMAILNHLNISVAGKHVTIVGTGALVGKPLAIMLMNELATVTTCNIKTKQLKEKCLQADILISAVGKKDLIRGSMIKKGAIVIDAGVDFVNHQMFGDVNVAEVSKVARFVTPTPGGVGPLTVVHLLRNTVLCAKQQYKKSN